MYPNNNKINIISFFLKKQNLILVLIFFFLANDSGVCKELKPDNIVRQFFTLVYQKEYKKAYDCFSNSVKDEVPLSKFKEGSENVKYLKILNITVKDREENLIKLKIKALLRIVYREHLYEAVYEGNVDVYLEGKQWKILTVDLEAKSQKLLEKDIKPSKLQKLDFGTSK
jgi:hypothetical protein